MATSPSALSDLQQRVLDAIADPDQVFLTGGGALAAFYLGHRRSHDVDLFTVDPVAVEEVAMKLRSAALEHGWQVEEIQSMPGYRRYRVLRGKDQTLVDLVHEPVPQIVALADKPLSGAIRYDALDDIVANKLGALLGRGDVKDLVDLYFIAENGIDVLADLETARQKDAGLEPSTLAWVLEGMSVDPGRLLMLREVTEPDLAQFRDHLVSRLVSMAWPPNGEHDNT